MVPKARAKSKAVKGRAIIVKPTVLTSKVVVVAKARRSTKTARRSPLASAPVRPPAAPSPFSPLPVEMGKRQHLEPPELEAFYKVLAPNIPASNERFWRAYFYLQFFYALKLNEPALICEKDVKGVKASAYATRAAGSAKIRVKRLKRGRDPTDSNAQREARAKAAARGVRRRARSEEGEGFDECMYDVTDKVLEAVNEVRQWKREKKVEENPFLFASNRQRKNGEIGVERLSQLRNSDGWQSVSRFTVWREFQKFTKAAGWPEHLRNAHVLRHTRAVFMLAAGVPQEEVCKQLGHSAMKMTERYVPAANALREKYGAAALGAF